MNRRLKILHIPAWYPSDRNPVAGIFIKEHVRAASLYHDCVVLYGEGVDQNIRGTYEIRESSEDGIWTFRFRYKKSPIPKTNVFIYLFVMFRAFHDLLKRGFRPNVIHAHIYSAGVVAILIGRLYSVPVVVTEQSSWFPRGMIKGAELLKAHVVFKHAAYVCPVSEYLKTYIQRLGIRARFWVIPNTVDTNLFHLPGNLPERLEGKKRLLTVALLTPVKGIPYLLEALAQIKAKRDDFILDIIGDGPNRAEYEALARKLGLDGIVYFHGLKTKQEIAEFMKKADFFVLPSLIETFGAVLIEAIACGKPVVATNIGGPSEIVIPEAGVLVPPQNSAALAEAIDHMLTNFREYNPEKIAQYAYNRYSHEVVGRMLDSVYRSIAR